MFPLQTTNSVTTWWPWRPKLLVSKLQQLHGMSRIIRLCFVLVTITPPQIAHFLSTQCWHTADMYNARKIMRRPATYANKLLWLGCFQVRRLLQEEIPMEKLVESNIFWRMLYFPAPKYSTRCLNCHAFAGHQRHSYSHPITLQYKLWTNNSIQC